MISQVVSRNRFFPFRVPGGESSFLMIQLPRMQAITLTYSCMRVQALTELRSFKTDIMP